MKRVLLALLVLAGCGPQGKPDPLAGYEHAQLLTKATFKEPWPFTMDSVVVHCEQGIYYLVSTPSGETYALNGSATSTQQYKPLEDIWLPDKSLGGSWRVSIAPVLLLAAKNCKQQ